MNANFVIMGLPASGKTTYLAALWHAIEAEETDCRLKLDRCEGDLTYLNAIAEAWRTFKKVPRTSQSGDVDVAIHLIDSETKTTGRAFFPDLAGETFDTQVESRQCQPIFVKNVEADDGLLLFISADSKQDTLSIVELDAMMPPGLGDVEFEVDAEMSAADPSTEATMAPAKFAEWEPKKVPGQVRIVQILSDLFRSPFVARARRLAVIISAWDLVTPSLTPERWLATNMPLVDQFLRTNGEFFASRIYGVSAQGVRLDDQEAVAAATRLPASHRISVVGPTGRDHDITGPLVWLMSNA